MNRNSPTVRHEFRMLPRGIVSSTNPADVIHFYYWPIIGWLFRKRCRMLLDIVGNRHYDSILEVAYGSGVLFPSLASMGNRLYGVDLHENAKTVGDMLGKLDVHAHFMRGDAMSIPCKDESVDCVVSLSMVEHLTDPGAAIGEMLRVLKPGGTLGLGFPVRNPWMDAGIRAFGFDTRKIHPSSHRDILRAVEKHRPIENFVKVPSFFPTDFSFYNCCSVTK